MIPEIGVMVGAYIVTRMLELIVGPNSRALIVARVCGADDSRLTSGYC
jgi:hypothetical protein